MKILITGTSGGIGKKIVEDLVCDGHEIQALNRTLTSEKDIYCNLEDTKSVLEVCDNIKNERYDVLINNAGGSIPKKFEELTLTDVEKRLNLNFVSPMLLMQAVLPGMVSRKYGRIINISSSTAKTPVPYLHIYSAAKSSLDSLTISLALYYSGNNITINSICPGGIDTEMSIHGRQIISRLKGLDSDTYQKAMINAIGNGELIDASYVSDMVSYLISDSGNCINGQRINVCGTMEVH